MYSGRGNVAFTTLGFPIRTSPAQRSVGNSPELFAATHVLLRLLAPRHPPHALSSLLTLISRRPASRRDFGTRDQGPGPSSSLRTRKKTALLESPASSAPGLSAQIHFRLVSRTSQQKLNSTLRMHLSKNALTTSHVRNLWSWTGSNRRHLACKASALPAELQPHNFQTCRGALPAGCHRSTSFPRWGTGGPRWT